MELSRELPGAHHVVRAWETHRIRVDDRWIERSFLLAPTRCVDVWDPDSIESLAASHFEPIFELEPEVILLGTGARQRFPGLELRTLPLTRGIGIEIMDNGAVARTFNLLAGEHRRVVAAFLLPG